MARRSIDRLILVFHAESGPLRAVMDSMQKLFLLRGCSLCEITHGLTGEKREWKSCKEDMGVPVDYLHLNEIPDELRAVVGKETPCVLARVGRDHIRLLGPDQLARCRGSV